MTFEMPCALAIGGLDPGGGAGVAADLRAFGAAGAFGGAVVAVHTVQSTDGMKSARAVPASQVSAQVREVLRHQRVRAVKLGALGSAENVRAVAREIQRHGGLAVVVDTPVAPSRGRGRLLARQALTAVRDELLPACTLVTVNCEEAAALVGHAVRTVGEAHDAARTLVAKHGASAALVKGGHLEGPWAIDVLALGRLDGHNGRDGEVEVIELRARRLAGQSAHGTGCTFASLVAGRLALRRGREIGRTELVAAVRWAKRAHHAALSHPVNVGGAARVLVF